MGEGMPSPPGRCLSSCAEVVRFLSGSGIYVATEWYMSLGLENIDLSLQDGEDVFIKVWGF